jgi:hypothetical protein
MRKPSFKWVAAVALIGSASAASAQDPPRIHKPRAAPPVQVGSTPIPAAEFDDKLTIEGDELKAKQVNSRLTVEAHVNGRGPYRFIVDSGADTSVVGLGIARDLQLPIGTPVVLNNMTSRNIVDRVKIDQLSFGPSSVYDLQLPALKESDLGSQGMLGIDALVHQRLMLDFERKLIRVEDARTRVIEPAGAIVITARRQRGQLILTRIRAAGVRLDAVIDTGSEITIGNLALRDKLIGRNKTDFETVDVTGVTGVTRKVEIAYVPEIELGSVVLQNVPVAFADLLPFQVFGLTDKPALLLGTDVLETFKTVSLDFRSRKVRFQLRKCQQDQNTMKAAAVTTASLLWARQPTSC